MSWITVEYLTTLAGVPGVKSDVIICRFVARALDEESVGPERARSLVVAAHDRLRSRPGSPQNLTAFDHATWLYQRSEV